jgi:hypothetical protein
MLAAIQFKMSYLSASCPKIYKCVVLCILIYKTVTVPVIFYGCETTFLTLREGRMCRLRVFENLWQGEHLDINGRM